MIQFANSTETTRRHTLVQGLHIYEAGLGHLQTMTQLIQVVLCIAIGTDVR